MGPHLSRLGRVLAGHGLATPLSYDRSRSARSSAQPHHSESLGSDEKAACDPTTLWSVGYDQIMHEEVQAALLAQKSPEQALIDAQARLVDIASVH